MNPTLHPRRRRRPPRRCVSPPHPHHTLRLTSTRIVQAPAKKAATKEPAAKKAPAKKPTAKGKGKEKQVEKENALSDLDDDSDAPAPKPSESRKNKSASETYTMLSQLEHILKHPDSYIGSVEQHTQNMWTWDSDSKRMVQRDVTFVPGFFKIVDEILVNAADHKVCSSVLFLSGKWASWSRVLCACRAPS